VKPLIGIVIGLALVAGAAEAQQIEIAPNGSRPSSQGPARWFTGAAVIDPLFSPTEHTRAGGALVTFAPGARTVWHTHPAGQTLQAWGGERRVIKPGDVVSIPPGVKHWHGATATNGMSHIAIQERVDGGVVEWLEPVSDDQYGGR